MHVRVMEASHTACNAKFRAKIDLTPDVCVCVFLFFLFRRTQEYVIPYKLSMHSVSIRFFLVSVPFSYRGRFSFRARHCHFDAKRGAVSSRHGVARRSPLATAANYEHPPPPMSTRHVLGVKMYVVFFTRT